MLNRKANNPNHDFEERVSQYRAKRILHAGFKRYRATFGDSVAEIAEYLGWTESKLRQMVYHNFYARKTEDIRLLCRLFQVDAHEATRPYCDDHDCDLSIEVMALDDERDEREASKVTQLFAEPMTEEEVDNPFGYLDIDAAKRALQKLTDAEVCELVSMRAEKMNQSNLLELTKDLMMLGMTRGSQTSLPLPEWD